MEMTRKGNPWVLSAEEIWESPLCDAVAVLCVRDKVEDRTRTFPTIKTWTSNKDYTVARLDSNEAMDMKKNQRYRSRWEGWVILQAIHSKQKTN